MYDVKGTVVEKTNEEKVIEWEIPDISVDAKNGSVITSPKFLFEDISWELELYTKSTMQAGFMNLLVIKEVVCDYSVEYHLGFKKLDGSVGHLKKGNLEGRLLWSDNFFFKLSEVQQWNSDNSDVITIVCKLKHKTTSSDQRQARMVNIPEHNSLLSK